MLLFVGSALTLAGSQWRAHAELKQRWDDLILDTAVEVEKICSECAAIGRTGSPQFIAHRTERVIRYTALVNELNESRAKFRFVASKRVQDSLLELFGKAVNEFLNDGGPDAHSAFETARAQFVAEVRKELRANTRRPRLRHL